MKKVVLVVLAMFSVIISKAQRGDNLGLLDRSRNHASNQSTPIKTPLFRAGNRIAAGGALIGIGGALTSAGIILAVDSDTKKSTVQILAGSGGGLCLIGGIILGGAASQFLRHENSGTAKLKFTGNSLVYSL